MTAAYISSLIVLLNFNFSREEATREVEAVQCFIYYSPKERKHSEEEF